MNLLKIALLTGTLCAFTLGFLLSSPKFSDKITAALVMIALLVVEGFLVLA